MTTDWVPLPDDVQCRQHDMFGRILFRMLDAWNRRRFVYWDMAIVEQEATTVRASLKSLISRTENDARIALGDPASVEELNADETRRYQVDHFLIYDNLLPHTRVVLYILDGLVTGMACAPKLKRCPRAVRVGVGDYYAPE